MEFNEKLQELRKLKNLTQEELAQKLFVSRTAISKWESGRGYPSIDSLKAIALFFDVTIDELLSSDEVLSIAEEDHQKTKKHFCDLVFGLLDFSIAMFFFLPFFGQKTNGVLESVSLLGLTEIQRYLRAVYYIAIISITLIGILTLAFQNMHFPFWMRRKTQISLFLNCLAAIVFTISLQPYAATFLLIIIGIKLMILAKAR